MSRHLIYPLLPLALIAFTGVTCRQPTITSLETSCQTEYQSLPVTVTSDQTTAQFTTDDIIQASLEDSLQVTIPNNTSSVLSEVYLNSSATEEEYIDHELHTLSGWEPEKPYTISLPNLPSGSIMRYFFCPEQDNDPTTEGCYPGCYTSRLFVQIIE